MHFKHFVGIICLGLISACTVPVVVDDTESVQNAHTSNNAPRSFLYSWAMFGDPVFDRDVVTFSESYSRAFGALEGQALFGNNFRQLAMPDANVMRAEFSKLASEAVDGEDLVVVMLTSHGSPGQIVAVAPDGTAFTITGEQLNKFLEPLENDRQVLILQACYSGSLINDLKHPNRIILTAAAEDRTSFGCNPNSDNTWFIRSLNRAIKEGGSWSKIFERTKAFVAVDEETAGVVPSNPQSWVGANMRGFWRNGVL